MGLRHIADTHYASVNERDLDRSAQVMTADVITDAPGAPGMRGLEAWKQFTTVFLNACPDATVRGDRYWESGDTIVAEGVFSGTHTGDLVTPAGAIPATGQKIALEFADVFKVRDGKAYEHRIYFDQGELMQQLGLMPRS